ncbi:hypothetical protein ABZ923_33510 [Streptomyces sp. NPDC046881]|uniref:hypothetical protein n=1 Tax=Streptomyces sp. NPDC046881 TaxID=3155374 RepID=UPI0033FA88D3
MAGQLCGAVTATPRDEALRALAHGVAACPQCRPPAAPQRAHGRTLAAANRN